MTPVTTFLRAEIERHGPIRFDRFMDIALYLPEQGYYRRSQDPFGKDGDFVTASQVQPLFGRLIASEAETLCPGRAVFDLGAGRREMARAFRGTYSGIEAGEPLPEDLSGFVLANEFFDALPVRAGIRHGGEFLERLVGWKEERCVFVEGPPLGPVEREYVQKYWPGVPEGGQFEIGREALNWIERIAALLTRGYLLIVDYGYQTAGTVRFPHGTLMSYRRQRAAEDVLLTPGDRDITAHVAFDAIRDQALLCGFKVLRFETLAQLTLAILQTNPSLVQSHRDRQQLKTLLIGMGEHFRALLLQKKDGP